MASLVVGVLRATYIRHPGCLAAQSTFDAAISSGIVIMVKWTLFIYSLNILYASRLN